MDPDIAREMVEQGAPMSYREARGWTILGAIALVGAVVASLFVVFGVVVLIAILVWG